MDRHRISAFGAVKLAGEKPQQRLSGAMDVEHCPGPGAGQQHGQDSSIEGHHAAKQLSADQREEVHAHVRGVVRRLCLRSAKQSDPGVISRFGLLERQHAGNFMHAIGAQRMMTVVNDDMPNIQWRRWSGGELRRTGEIRVTQSGDGHCR